LIDSFNSIELLDDYVALLIKALQRDDNAKVLDFTAELRIYWCHFALALLAVWEVRRTKATSSGLDGDENRHYYVSVIMNCVKIIIEHTSKHEETGCSGLPFLTVVFQWLSIEKNQYILVEALGDRVIPFVPFYI
jgi:hypothetical protein